MTLYGYARVWVTFSLPSWSGHLCWPFIRVVQFYSAKRSTISPPLTRYLEADEGSPEAFFGQVQVMFAAWVADQELQSVKRRTKEGLERAREQGKVLGPPRKFRPNQVETMRRMREGGASLRRIAADFECSASTVLRVLSEKSGVAMTVPTRIP